MGSAHIFVFRIDKYEAAPPETKEDARPAVSLVLTVEEELKGHLLQGVGPSFSLLAVRRNGGRWYRWRWSDGNSDGPFKVGGRFLAFCDGTSEDATLLMKDYSTRAREHCGEFIALPDEDGALEDTRIIVALERAGASVEDVLHIAHAQVAERGRLFAQYVCARIDSSRIPNERLVFVMNLIASPRIGASARYFYLEAVESVLSMASRPSSPVYGTHDELEAPWIRLIFRLCEAGKDVRLVSYPETVLWYAIGLDKPVPRHLARDVFLSAPREREAAIAFVRRPAEYRSTDLSWKPRMLEWLTEKASSTQ